MEFDHPIVKYLTSFTLINIFSGRHASQLQGYLTRFEVLQIGNVDYLRDMGAGLISGSLLINWK